MKYIIAMFRFYTKLQSSVICYLYFNRNISRNKNINLHKLQLSKYSQGTRNKIEQSLPHGGASDLLSNTINTQNVLFVCVSPCYVGTCMIHNTLSMPVHRTFFTAAAHKIFVK